jgi:hypothetical protein
MSTLRILREERTVAKARKPKRGKGPTLHSWKVTRTNGISPREVTLSAEGLSVVDGDLVFSANDVVVRVIAANTYTDVLLDGHSEN